MTEKNKNASYPFSGEILKITEQKIIAYNPLYCKIGFGSTGAIMLSQAIYWSERNDDGWFFQSQEKWEDETGLTRREQETARSRLREAGVLLEYRQRMPNRLYFKVDFDRLAEILNAYIESKLLENEEANITNVENEHSESRIPPFRESDSAIQRVGFRHSNIKRLTKEIKEDSNKDIKESKAMAKNDFCPIGFLVENGLTKEEANDWIKIRGKKTCTQSSFNLLLKKYGPMGYDSLADAIRNSIAQGWRGIFPEKQAQSKNKPDWLHPEIVVKEDRPLTPEERAAYDKDVENIDW